MPCWTLKQVGANRYQAPAGSEAVQSSAQPERIAL